MAETVNQETNGTASEEQGQRTFTQEEVNTMIGDRLAREHAKYADYEDLKAKAAKFDKEEEASKSELQKATEKADALEKELNGLKKQAELSEIRSKVATETGVPADLLFGEDEESCKKQAEAILKFAQKPGTYPDVRKISGKASAQPSEGSADYRALARQLFNR